MWQRLGVFKPKRHRIPYDGRKILTRLQQGLGSKRNSLRVKKGASGSDGAQFTEKQSFRVFQVCAKLLNSIEFSLWGGHWSNVWIGWFDMVRLDCDGHSAAKPRPGLQPIPCWTGVAVCGPASRPHCPQWQEDLPESS